MEGSSMALMVGVRSMTRIVLCCASLCLIVGVAWAQAASSRKIVVFEVGTPLKVQQQVVALSLSTIINVLSLSDSIAIALPLLNPDLALAILQLDPNVEEVIEDQLTVIDGTTCVDSKGPPITEAHGWGLQKSDFPTAQKQWNVNGAGIRVAVVDTGIYAAHTDLQGRVASGYNVTAEPNSDQNGHGTHIAGIIAADVNNLGLIGGAPQVTLVPVKMLNSKGIGYLSDFCKALEWVSNNGIQVVNMSVGFQDSIPLLRTTQALYNLGVIQVAAAGNRCATAPKQEDGGGDECHKGSSTVCDNPQTDVKCPACYSWVLAVGATNVNDDVSSYSCQGAEIDFVAPGGDLQVPILSTNKGGGYGGASGTSQAAAHAAAAVVLTLQRQPGLSFEGMRSVLRATAKNLGVNKQLQGAGRLDAQKMMEALPWKQ
jgi:subtilisin family serine protease